MLFCKLKLNYFGQFQNREIELKPGINLIYGENEAGKSTLHAFVKGMLFGIEKMRGRGSASRDDLYTRYLPWDYPGAFGGSMDIKSGGKEYRLLRSFHTTDKHFTIIELSTGREITLEEGVISELIPGLTESAFRNTVSIEQRKAQTDPELAVEMQNYITNLSMAKNQEVNVSKAVSYLNEQRKQLEASQNQSVRKALQEEIEDGLEKEDRMNRLTVRLDELQSVQRQLELQMEELMPSSDEDSIKRMEQLPAILEKYSIYEALAKQINQLKLQQEEQEEKIAFLQDKVQSMISLKEDRKEAETLQKELFELTGKLPEYQKERKGILTSGRRKRYLSIAAAILFAAFCVLATDFQQYGLLLGAAFMAGGFIAFIIINHKYKKLLKEKEAGFMQCREKQGSLQRRLEEILKRNGVISMEEAVRKQEELMKNSYALEHARQQVNELKERRKETEDKQDVLYDVIMRYLQYFMTAEKLSAQVMQSLREALHLKKQNREEKQAKLKQQFDQCRLETERLRWEISSLEENGDQLIRNQDRYKELLRQQKEDAMELRAVEMALTSIEELSSEIHDSFGQKLNTAVSGTISKVTNQKYKNLKVSEMLRVKVDFNGDYILMERLSAGTMDQIYFSLRLAVAGLLFGKEEIPLLLDDSFALYDDRRVRAALKEVAKHGQTLLFTCHKREHELLNEMGLPYHLIDLSVL